MKASSISQLHGSNCEEPKFMMNALFLLFCLWFLYSDQRYFTFVRRDQICDSLTAFCFEKVSPFDLFLRDIADSYPAFDIERAVTNNDTLALKFFHEVLLKCTEMKVLIVESINSLEWILPAIHPQLKFVSAPNFYQRGHNI